MSVAFELVVRPSRRARLLAMLPRSAAAAGLALAAVQVKDGTAGAIDSTIAALAVAALAIAALVFAVLAVAALAGAALASTPNWPAMLRRTHHPTPVQPLRLRVDADGRAALLDGRDESPEPGLEPPAECASVDRAAPPVRWWRLPGLIFIELESASGASPSLLLGRDSIPESQWRQLNVWLCWLERGRHGAGGV